MPVPWPLAYAAARVAAVLTAMRGREPQLLVPDEVRLARLPMRFDDTRARLELGHTSRPAAETLAAAARAYI
jgi:dihydroflavonol-4-reductase